MQLRKEPIVFLVAVGVLGLLAWSALSDGAGRRSSGRKADAPVLDARPVPDPALALPGERQSSARPRDLFSPPSDTRPLPPLALERPPLAPLPALAPPPVPGPRPRLWGRFLRGPARTVAVPDLFAPAEEAEPLPLAPAAVPSGKGAALSPEETAARIAGWKRTYDWYRIVEFRFGQIRNPDRYRLAKRPDEDLLFVEFDPETGQPRFPGQAPARIPRKSVTEFDFAQTVPNQIEIRLAQFGERLSAAEYDQALAFADWCVEQSLRTPRALEVAAEMYTRASAVLQEDPLPRLGLARVHEAAFRFEEAFALYRGLLDGPMRNNPLVLVRLAQLEQRFRLFDKAEQRLREAERYGRTQWMVQEALGRFLLEHGSAAEAVEHLRLANQFEPQMPDARRERGRLRAALGAALLAVGEVREGAEWFEKAVQADPAGEEGLTGLVCARLLGAPGPASNGAAAAPAGGEVASRGFDLTLATGLELARGGDAASAQRARELLTAAAEIDPLRAPLAWRGLSWLAEATGHPEEALRFADLALEGDPTDAWAHFQRGRLLVQRDDLDGATESLRVALEIDAEFGDALAWLGEVAYRRGELVAADRYFERALALDPALTAAEVLRGITLLELGSVRDAEAAFRSVLGAQNDEPAARGGLAWCYYLSGNPIEALTRFAELDDARRAHPEDDPWRVWARRQIARVTDHAEKVVWSDRFERNALQNGWLVQESHGPLVSIHDGLVSIAGTFRSAGRSRLWQLRNAGDFVSIEARLTARSGTTARVGLFVSRETQRSGETQVEAEVSVSRHPDPGKNVIQARAMKRGEEDLPQTDVAGFEWKLDQTVLLRIERLGDSSDTRVRCSLDGIPVMAETPLPALGRTTNELRIGIYAEGQPGRSVQLDVDDVEIVYRQKGP